MFRLIAGCCACCCRPRPTVGVLLLGMSAVAVVVVVHPMVGTTGTDGGSGPRLWLLALLIGPAALGALRTGSLSRFGGRCARH